MDAKSIQNRSRKKVRKRSLQWAGAVARRGPLVVQLFKNAPQVTYQSTKTTEGNLQKVTYLRRKTKGGNILEVKYQKVTYRGYFTEVKYKKVTYGGYFTKVKY